MQKVLSSITWDTQQVIIHLLRLNICIVGVPVIVINIHFQFHKLCFVLLELHLMYSKKVKSLHTASPVYSPLFG
jgi:hypothetical protein